VGAAIIDNGRLLAAQRAEPPELAGAWEFPGGKVDPGETDQQALIRECREELGVDIVVGDRIGADWPLAIDGYIMRVWTAIIRRGEPEPLEHLELRWLTRDSLFDVAWVPADLPVVHALDDHLAG